MHLLHVFFGIFYRFLPFLFLKNPLKTSFEVLFPQAKEYQELFEAGNSYSGNRESPTMIV